MFIIQFGTFEMMKRIGITGGIGSGKSLICNILEEKGYSVFYSDDTAKKLMLDDKEIIHQIKSLLGDNAYVEGALNKEWIAHQIFNDSVKREQINNIIHPAVYRKLDEWSAQLNGFVFVESALMLDTGFYKMLDKVILVIADEQVRIQRVKERDELTMEEIKKRIKSQSSDEDKIKLSDYQIYNNGDVEEAKRQLEKILDLIQSDLLDYWTD